MPPRKKCNSLTLVSVGALVLVALTGLWLCTFRPAGIPVYEAMPREVLEWPEPQDYMDAVAHDRSYPNGITVRSIIKEMDFDSDSEIESRVAITRAQSFSLRNVKPKLRHILTEFNWISHGKSSVAQSLRFWVYELPNWSAYHPPRLVQASEIDQPLDEGDQVLILIPSRE